MARKAAKTEAAREAIAAFVEGNASRLQEWLDEIANGKTNDRGAWLTQPDPEKAFRLVLELMEYHLPKLARTEVVAEVSHRVTEMSEAELERIARGGGSRAAEKEASAAKSPGLH